MQYLASAILTLGRPEYVAFKISTVARWVCADRWGSWCCSLSCRGLCTLLGWLRSRWGGWCWVARIPARVRVPCAATLAACSRRTGCRHCARCHALERISHGTRGGRGARARGHEDVWRRRRRARDWRGRRNTPPADPFSVDGQRRRGAEGGAAGGALFGKRVVVLICCFCRNFSTFGRCGIDRYLWPDCWLSLAVALVEL